MLKSKILVLAMLLLSTAGQCALAQGHKKTSAVASQPITFETLVTEYHFPVMQNTGNPEKDQQTYKLAKGKWISENRELYRRYHAQFAVPNQEPRKVSQPSFGESAAKPVNSNPGPGKVVQPSYTQSK